MRTAPLLVVLAWVTQALGCALPQSEACVQYVACQEAVDDSVDTSDWDEGGRCWRNPRTAALCDGQCTEALAALAETPDAPEPCLR